MSAILKYVVVFYLMCHYGIYPINAQREIDSRPFIESVGVQIGIGSTKLLDLDYTYEVLLVKVPLKRQFIVKNSFGLNLQLIPQGNVAFHIAEGHARENGFELGATCGLEASKDIIRNTFSIALGVAVGPMYVSNTPSRQNKGFIFSDELSTALYYKISGHQQLQFIVGFRHLSNANIRQPNGGINVLWSAIGLSWKL